MSAAACQSGAACVCTALAARPIAPLLHAKYCMLGCAGAPIENLYPAVVEDVSKEEQCAAFVHEVVEQHGAIDHAVSCFGAW